MDKDLTVFAFWCKQLSVYENKNKFKQYKHSMRPHRTHFKNTCIDWYVYHIGFVEIKLVFIKLVEYFICVFAV